ncbi:XrtA-associated ATPase [Aquincola tertiaricarbonis]|uniref:Secretion ATPase n=1 Tax=Aquincola tertiaricarbonis TaxID=391953 RepID=A0A1S6R6H7_AQUTE|nr:XrtA/PEP-CTERM system-associated ATPase [Aquincola tertiaricarbonis]AQW45579.1 secretion ATPase [Aquincola tertiaricarbonis]URI10242.1 XrtA-associated ATPase [Aquincola tertiaricarbonis]
MYEAFYGLSNKPFQLNPDPSFYFDSKQHRRAKAYLEYGVMRNEGFIVITGEVGAGKTTILRGLLDSLNRSDVVVGQLVTTQLDAEDTLRMVGAAFGFQVKGVTKSELLITLEAFLIGQASQGKRCLLVVDEAQNLSPRAVEELRMLSNYQLGTQALLQSFLVGQPEFREILQRPEMEQFRQRVAATCHIGPLDLEDTQHYIEHRLKCAGSTGQPEFEPEAFQAIFNASQGIPRRINAVCDRLLLLGYLNNKTLLTVADVDEVVKEFAREGGASASMPVARPASASALGGATLPVEQVGPLGDVDIDPSKLALSAEAAEGMSRQLDTLAAQAHGDRLQRLERSLLRLERINLETLSLLQRLVGALKTPNDGSER